MNYQRGLLSLFSLCSEVRITPHHENGLLHLHLVWCSILSSETAETLAAARVSGVASFSATLVGPSDRIRTCGILLPKQARYQLRYTRLFRYFIRLGVFSQMWRPTNWATPGYSISVIIPQRGRKSKFFLSVVIYVVKAAFVPLSAIGINPVNAGVTRLSGVLPCSTPDTATALPKQARYQLRYTRLYIVGLSDRPHSIPYSAPVFKSFLHRQPQKV